MSHSSLQTAQPTNSWLAVMRLSLNKFRCPKFETRFIALFVFSLVLGLSSQQVAQAQVNVALSVDATTKDVNTPFTYTLDIVCPSTTGTCTNAVVTFPLPSSLDYIGTSPATGNVQSISYSSANNTVTVTMNPAINGTTDQLQVVVNFKGDTYTGTVATGTAYGGPGKTNPSNIVSTTATNGTAPPDFEEQLSIQKNSGSVIDVAMPGGGLIYDLFFANQSQNNAITDLVVEDILPTGFTLTQVASFYFWKNPAAAAGIHSNMYYKTSSNSTYTIWPGSPFSYADYNLLTVSSLGLASGEGITALKWVFTDPIPGTTFNRTGDGYAKIYGTLNSNVTPGSKVSNCMTASGTLGGQPVPIFDKQTYSISPTGSSCFDYNILPAGLMAFLEKYQDPSKAGYLAGDTINYVIQHQNTTSSAVDLKDFKFIDLLPGELDYVSSTLELGTNFLPSKDAVLAVTPTVTPNFNGTGKTRLLWDFTGITENPSDNYVQLNIHIKAKVKTGVPTGVINNEAYLSTQGGVFVRCISDNRNGSDNYSSIVDAMDLNADGSTTDSLCKVINPATIVFPTGAGLESIKWVKGTLDTDYSRFPNSGQTSPGGTADYKMSITNKGNVAMKDIKIIDILPFVGDKGVIDLSARNTQWRPFLIAPVTTTAPNVTVYYSTAQNPCRDELTLGIPSGCTPPNWTTTLPADPTTVQSLKFDFGATIMQPNDVIELRWSMRAPIDAPTNGEIAWNSFGYITSRNDNGVALLASEPIKVGIAVMPVRPAAYGNYVWKDQNKNGIQDETPANGINGVKVDLYKAAGATANIATDQLVTFTLTSSKNGNPGYYQFSNLTPGNYYAVFHKPINNCVITTPNVITPNDSLDSDGIQTIIGTDTLAITEITTLDVGEIDFRWDLGLAPIVGTCGLAMTVTPGLCDPATNAYVLSGTVTATNVPTSGTLTISSGAFANRTITLPAGNASGSFSYSGLVSTGQAYTVTASYSDAACAAVSQTYSAPASCSVAPVCSIAATAIAGSCATATNTYSATVVVNLTSAPAGTLTVSVPGATPITQTLAANTGSFTAVFAGLPSDGASQVATISLPNCGSTTANFTAPASCSIAPICSVSATATAGTCDPATNTYSSTVVVTVNNPSTGTLSVADGGQTLTFSTTANSQNTFTATFTGLTSDGTNHIVTASLPGCSSATANYTAPASCSVAPVCSISATATAGTCEPTTNAYSATVVVTVKNPATGTLTIANGTVTQTLSTTAGSQNTFTVIFPSLLSDGANHIVTASLPGCSSMTANYTAPASCTTAPVCTLSLTASGANCNPTTNLYVLSGAIILTNSPTSQTLTLTDGSYVRSLTAIAGTTTINFSYTTLQSDGALHTVTVTSSAASCGTASTTYTAPASCTVAPVCSVSAVATPGLCASATSTFSNTVLVTLSNPTAGTLTVTDGAASVTFVVPASPGTLTTTAVFNGLVANGSSHSVTVNLSGCSSTTVAYTAPASCSTAPVCSLSAVATAGICASATNTYSATAVVRLSNPSVGVLTVTNGAQSLTFATTAVSSATFTATFNGLTSDGVVHTITASLPGCSSTTATYTAPASCSVAPVLALAITPGTCNTATNQYATSGTISLTAAIAGTLTITDGSSTTTVAVTAGQTSANFSLAGLNSGTGSHTVTVSGTGYNPISATYTAPVSCTVAPPCLLSVIVTPGVCNSATNQYSISGSVLAVNASGSQMVTITDGVASTTLTLTANGPASFTLSGLASNGVLHTVVASAVTCGQSSTTYTAPASCTYTCQPPIHVCKGTSYAVKLSVTAGQSSYQWYHEGVAIQGATASSYTATQAGSYSVVVNGNVSGQCPDGSCCPIVLVEDSVALYQANAQAPTCTSATSSSANADGRIVATQWKLSGSDTTHYYYQVSLGGSFNVAQLVAGGATQSVPVDGVLVANLPNPATVSGQTYTVRITNGLGCYRDVVVNLAQTVCDCPPAKCVPFVVKRIR